MQVDELGVYMPVGGMLIIAALLGAAMVLIPTLLGMRRTHNAVEDSPYECGMPPLEEAHARFSVKFYVTAMLFIVFDLEGVFLLGWAAVYRDLIRPVSEGGIGWPLLWGGVIFLLVLEVAHVYAWRKGVLDWAPRPRARKPALEQT
ncbi:MAG: NADH-quinone oxidoreductase subunit A [Verrucomicrobia bacterium]|nr:NADH-quinone oxidoreductase subunit A [Verrucomicrobiota bacterium]